MVVCRYEKDSDKCHRWQWVCHSAEMPFSPIPQQRCSLHRSQSLVKWLNLDIHMHAATHETECICLSYSAAALVDRADRMFLAARPGRQHTICWPGERGHGDPQGRRMRCCDCGWTTVSCWQSRLCQHISRAIFKMTSSGDSPILLSYGNAHSLRG